MRRALLLLFIALSVFLFCSCTSTETTRFSLTREGSSSSEIGILVGNVTYGMGFFFPSSSDILDIALIKTDSLTGLVSEISHQRIRNLLNFPVQFTVRYDKSDLLESDKCSLIVTLLVGGEVKAQGITLLQRNGSDFQEASLVLTSI